MKKARPTNEPDDMQTEYDFQGGIRGKYASRYPVVALDPDVAAGFDDAEAVNAALRAFLKDRSNKNCD